MEDIRKGKYRHFKGNEYLVLGVAKHSENLEEFVVYCSVTDAAQLWIRPKGMFFEKVKVGDQEVPRFKFMDEV